MYFERFCLSLLRNLETDGVALISYGRQFQIASAAQRKAYDPIFVGDVYVIIIIFLLLFILFFKLTTWFKNSLERLLVMAWLFDESAPERYFIKPLNDDGDALEEEECLPGVIRLGW